MNIFLRILGIALIVVSVLLLFAVPAAGVIGVIIGVFCILRSSPRIAEKIKQSHVKAVEKLKINNETPTAPIRKITLQEQSTENRIRMEEAGLKLYVWSTSGDERVCDACRIMDEKLCRWESSFVFSEDGGKTWKRRPEGAVMSHPGQCEACRCRCTSLSYEPELLGEI